VNRPAIAPLSLAVTLCLIALAAGQEARIRVRADRPGPGVSRHMTGVSRRSS
jgi:hypothetical protein